MKPVTTSRKYHVKQRLQILKDLGIQQPAQEVIDFCLDEARCSDTRCDNIFLDYVTKGKQTAKKGKKGKRYGVAKSFA